MESRYNAILEKKYMDDEEIYKSRLKGGLLKRKICCSLIDLFSGAGGMTLGFTKTFGHTFKSVWANDFNEYAVRSYNLNFGEHCVSGDIVGLLDRFKLNIPHADVVIGGPPCQGFSLLNRTSLGVSRVGFAAVFQVSVGIHCKRGNRFAAGVQRFIEILESHGSGIFANRLAE